MLHRHGCAHAHRGAGPSGFRLPNDRPQWPRGREFSLDRLSLEVGLDHEAKRVDGTAILQLRRIDPAARWAELDAIAFELLAVERRTDTGWASAAYEYDAEKLRLDLSDVLDGGVAEVRVRYRAFPQRGLYFTAPDASRPDRPRQVWSQCQDQDGRHWFPCQDHPGQRMLTDLKVEVPKGWFALSNGVLAERADTAAGTRFHWVQADPHPAYLVTLAAGEFDEAHDDLDGLPLSYYVPKGKGSMIERSFGRTKEMVRAFSQRLATPFPWDKYAQVVVADFIFGGMENTSATTLFERALVDERAALDTDVDSLIAHELAHQWFGDLVTCRDWSHAWLNEGFATYMEHVWKEHHDGPDDYLYSLEMDLDLYLSEYGGRYARPIVEKTWAAPIDIFDRHLYQKGGLVLHALREHLGEDVFFRGLRFYLERHRGGGVETRDFLRAMEDATGRSLEELFFQWTARAGHPKLAVSAEHSDGALRVTVRQTQGKTDHDLYHLRLPVTVVTAEGSRAQILDVTRREETFALACPSSPVRVIVDPRMSAPGTLKLDLSTTLLINQLHDAEEARARWLAARALAGKSEPRVVVALERALSTDPFFGVRAEAAGALGKHRTDAAFAALEKGIGDGDARVRRAVAAAHGEYRTPESADRLIAWIDRGDPSYLVEAGLRRSLGLTRDTRALPRLARSVKEDRGSWGEVVIGGAAEGLAKLRDPAAIAPLLEALRDITTPSTARRTIVGSLAEMREVTSDPPTLRLIREVAEDQLEDLDPNVRIAVARLIVGLRDPAGRSTLTRLAEGDLDGRVRRAARESARDLGAHIASPPQVSALSDAVEALRQEVKELRSKLAALSPDKTPEKSAEKAAETSEKT
ncbi:MAG: M1 family aminopeptidase [Sandaracinaceae bacterium]